jgi:Cu(I)/Ag(I) efflux system membrane protein CusA/SilA
MLAAAALLSVTFAPALRDLLIRGKIRREADHPVSRHHPRRLRALRLRRPAPPDHHPGDRRARRALGRSPSTCASAASSCRPQRGRHPLHADHPARPLDRGGQAPARQPGRDARRLPRGRARVRQGRPRRDPHRSRAAQHGRDRRQLKPPEQWPTVTLARWHSGWAPDWLRALLTYLWPESAPRPGTSWSPSSNASLQLPGWTGAYTMPIRARVDMLTTGVRTPSASRSSAPTSRHRAHRPPARAILRRRPRHPQRALRAQPRRRLRRHRPPPRRPRALRPAVEDLTDLVEAPSAARPSPPPSRAAAASPSRSA